jgi:hypothetical protein
MEDCIKHIPLPQTESQKTIPNYTKGEILRENKYEKVKTYAEMCN